MDNNDIKKQIKLMLVEKCWTQEQLVQELGKRLNKKYSSSNLGNKIRLGTISHKEMVLIADILGYRVKFEKK